MDNGTFYRLKLSFLWYMPSRVFDLGTLLKHDYFYNIFESIDRWIFLPRLTSLFENNWLCRVYFIITDLIA